MIHMCDKMMNSLSATYYIKKTEHSIINTFLRLKLRSHTLHAFPVDVLISSAEKNGETPDILLSLFFSASLSDVSASLSDDSIALPK